MKELIDKALLITFGETASILHSDMTISKCIDNKLVRKPAERKPDERYDWIENE